MRKTKKRRGRGEGSIYQRESDGRWVGSVVVGYTADTGKPIRKVVYRATKQEAQDALDELRGKIKAGEPDGDKFPLRRALEFWLDSKVKPRVDEATYKLHQQRIHDFIIPHLGHLPVAAISPYMVQAWLEQLEAKGRTADLRNKCGQLLRRCLDQCVEYGYLRTNPARKLSLPSTRAEEMHPLDAAQARRFLAAAAKHRLAALWLLGLDSGMRQGEILALTWNDIDFAAGLVSVTKSLRTGDKGGPRVKEVKTKASRRRIRLTRATLDALAEHRKRAHGPLVFSTPGRGRHRGTRRHLNKANLRKCFKKLLRKADLPLVRFHDLRHTHATLALQETKNVKAVSARLGHADVRVTLNTYAHYLPVVEEEYVSAMERLLAPQGEAQAASAAAVMTETAPKA